MENNIVISTQLPQKIIDKMELSISQYLKEVTRLFLDRTALVNPDTDERKTYAEVFQESHKISNYLRELGCGRGTIIGIVLENRLEYLSILLGAWDIGATCCLFPAEYCSTEIRHALHISQPKVVFTCNVMFPRVKNLWPEFSFITRIINIDAEIYSSNSKITTTLHTNPPTSTDTAIILFSSGTTGLPKGVKLAHKSLIFQLEINRSNMLSHSQRENVFLISKPMGNIGGLMSMLCSFVRNQTAVPIRNYNDKIFWTYVQKYRPAVISPSASSVEYFLENVAVFKDNFSNLRSILLGGHFLRKEIEDSFRSYFNKCHFRQVYGLTETTGPCTQLRGDQPIKSGSVGFLIPGMMAKVVDLRDNTALGAFQKGELFLKGPNLMNRYCLNEQNNDLGFDENGWFHTGDVVYYDDDFYFYIVDRIKELIKYKSYQVSPWELELILLEHDAVLEVGVIGIPNDDAGELPRAYVVKRMGYDDIDEIQLQQYVENRVAPWKKLSGGVTFLENLPKTASGKIKRKELKKLSLELTDSL